MNFQKAYEALKQGAMIKCPEWAGYWKWEDNSIKMHCKDGRILDIRETENVDYTLNFILRDDWEVVGEADVKDLDIIGIKNPLRVHTYNSSENYEVIDVYSANKSLLNLFGRLAYLLYKKLRG